MTSSRIQAALGDYDPGLACAACRGTGKVRVGSPYGRGSGFGWRDCLRCANTATGLEPPPLCDFCGSEALHVTAQHGRSTFTARCADCTAHHLIATATTEDTNGTK